MGDMVVKLCGARKRRRGGELPFRFEAFGSPGYPADFAGGCFQDNVAALLGLAQPEAAGADQDTSPNKCWSLLLELQRHPPTTVRLFVVEEDMEKSSARQRHCHLCRAVGWGRHLISSRRYHFILPKKEAVVERCGVSYEFPCGESPEPATLSRAAPASKAAHSLHGVVHLNGFGHLVGVNGFQGGSEFVSGRQVMDLWDRICSSLRVKAVSVVDTARKNNMELRLVHGVAYGEPWFGRWGYKFGHPCYNVTVTTYRQSVDALRRLPLCLLMPHFSCLSQEVAMVIAKYQAVSALLILNLGDLLRFMLEMKPRLPVSSVCAADYRSIMSDVTCRWSARRIDMAARVVVDALRQRGGGGEGRVWVTRQEVRDAARVLVGDTGLLDFVLKSLGDRVVGAHVVRRAVNPVTNVLEYCLEDIAAGVPVQTGKASSRFQLTRVQLKRDLLLLYKHVLKEPNRSLATGVFGAVPVAVRMVLDTKHFVKEFFVGQETVPAAMKSNGGNDEEVLVLSCTVHVVNGRDSRDQLPPCELVAVAASATVGELKAAVQELFRGMYVGLRTFTAHAISGAVAVLDGSAVLGAVDVGRSVVVEGRVDEESAAAVYEGGGEGGEAAVVECGCGAAEEDGERMVCCDVCEVWQHTRCVGVAEDDEVPPVYLCSRCEGGLVTVPALSC